MFGLFLIVTHCKIEMCHMENQYFFPKPIYVGRYVNKSNYLDKDLPT
jgi:hypothetical protein